MKKIISLLIVIVLIGASGVFAVSASSNTTKQDKTQAIAQGQQEINQKKADIAQKVQQFKTKQEEWQSCKKALSDKISELMSNKGLNQDLISENKQLRLQLSKALEELKESGTALSDETAATLKDYKEQIKAQSDEMKATKGKIKDLLQQNKELIKNKDYVQMDLVYAQIDQIQLTRNDQLQSINNILVEMIELVG